MGVIRQTALAPERSRLGELDPLARKLLEKFLGTVRTPAERAADHRHESTISEQDFLPVWFLRAGYRAVAHLEFGTLEQTMVGRGSW